MDKISKKEKKFIQQLRFTVSKTITKNLLIETGDKVILGLSGGKDSYTLLETLAFIKKYVKDNFDLIAVHIKIKNFEYEVDFDYMKNVCDQLNIPLIFKDIEIEDKTGEYPCFICSWSRRKELFNLTRELNCNKLALGHHKDDSIETLLMNMVYHGSISALPVKLKMFDGRITLIRPLMELENKDMVEYSRLREFPKMIKSCPYADDSKRETIRDIADKLYGLHQLSKVNIFNSMSNIYPEYLPAIQK